MADKKRGSLTPIKGGPKNMTPAQIAAAQYERAAEVFRRIVETGLSEYDNLILVGLLDGRVELVHALDPSSVSEITGALDDAKFRYQVESYLTTEE